MLDSSAALRMCIPRLNVIGAVDCIDFARLPDAGFEELTFADWIKEAFNVGNNLLSWKLDYFLGIWQGEITFNVSHSLPTR